MSPISTEEDQHGRRQTCRSDAHHDAVLAWWGFTVLTKLGFGLVAVAIGFLVGQGAARFAGGKRSVGLQVLAVVVGALSFLVAAYLVNMTFINEVLAQKGQAWRVPFPPASPGMFYQVLAVNFGVMKLVFLAIVVYEEDEDRKSTRLNSSHGYISYAAFCLK